MTTLAEKIVGLHRALDARDIPHAVGGAIALAFHTREPRATKDIDINVFVDPAEAADVFSALPRDIKIRAGDSAAVVREGQVRLFWGETPIDLFFAYHEFHRQAATDAEVVDFDGEPLPILSATDLTVFKAFFARTKDFADIEAMADAGAVDAARALRWIADLLGEDNDAYARLALALDPQRRLATRPNVLRSALSGPRNPTVPPGDTACGRWMSIARRNCTRRSGHRGPCR